MSYGVVASKSAQLLVEPAHEPADAAHGDPELARFASAWSSQWVPGRLTLTRLHLSFLCNRGAREAASVNLSLAGVTAVEVCGGRLSRQVGVRHGPWLLRLRVGGAEQIAQRIDELSQAAKHTSPAGRSSLTRY